MARHSRTIDFKSWRGMTPLFTAVTTATTIVSPPLTPGEPVTILRCRGLIHAFLDSTRQVGDTISLTFGLGIVSQDAAALGASAMPDPGSEPDYPWLWWGTMFLDGQLAAGGENPWGASAQKLEVDTKAMRKMKPRESLVWVMQSDTVAGAPVTEVRIHQTRVLVGQ